VDLRRLRTSGAGANEMRVAMRWASGTSQSIARIPYGDTRQLTSAQRRTVFAPHSPTLLGAAGEDAAVTLTWEGVEPGASIQIYRNGRQIGSMTSGGRFEDRDAWAPGTACYSLTQRFDDTRLTSLSSRERCVSVPEPITLAAGGGLAANDGAAVSTVEGVARYQDWGLPAQELRATFIAHAAGSYRIELKYANAHGPINTGITAAVKAVTARCAGDAPQSGSLVMPHLDSSVPWGFSSGFHFKASAETACELRIADGFNMSYLSHFARYTGGQGGAAGVLNRADIAAARIELIGGLNR
jgi:hypothetical protein